MLDRFYIARYITRSGGKKNKKKTKFIFVAIQCETPSVWAAIIFNARPAVISLELSPPTPPALLAPRPPFTPRPLFLFLFFLRLVPRKPNNSVPFCQVLCFCHSQIPLNGRKIKLATVGQRIRS